MDSFGAVAALGMGEVFPLTWTQAGNRMRLLLVHGAFHGPWFWHSVISSLAPLGPHVETVELPSVAAKGSRATACSMTRRRSVVV
jgi:hypothetical protein